jgi:hypothetical protein
MNKIELDYLKIEGEPKLWADRFLLFYLPSYFPTTYQKYSPLLTAYRAFLEARIKQGDQSASKILSKPGLYPDPNWVDAATKYKWAERAQSFVDRQIQVQVTENRARFFDILDTRLNTLLATSKVLEKLVKKCDQFVNDYYQKDG